MFRQVILGSLLISVSISVEAVFIGLAVVWLRRLGGRLVSGRRVLKQTLLLIVTTLWLLAAIAVSTWIWAMAFMILGLAGEFVAEFRPQRFAEDHELAGGFGGFA